jgi:O-antigen/teichoic acid export membrane protein
MRFRKEALLTIVIQLLCLGFGIGVSILLNRGLGPTLKGKFVVLLLIPQLIIAFSNLGLGVSGSYFMGAKKFPEGDILKSNLFAAVSIGVIGAIIAWWIVRTQFPGMNHLLYYLVPLLVVSGLWIENYLPDIFLGKGRTILYNKWNLFQVIGKFCLIAFFFLLFENKLYGAIVAVLVLSFVSFGLSFRVLSGIMSLKGKINRMYLSRGVNFGYKVFAANILGFLNRRFDMLMLQWIKGPTQVGYYSVAVGLVERLWIIPTAISLVLYSRIVTGQFTKRDVVPRVSRVSLWGIIGIAVISIPVIKPIIVLLYSETFLPCLHPYLILLPGVVALTIPKLLTQEFVGRWGKPQFSAYGMLAVVATNAGLNLLFIPRMGMNGAALASTIAYVVELAIFVRLYGKITDTKAKDLLVPKREDFTPWLPR